MLTGNVPSPSLLQLEPFPMDMRPRGEWGDRGRFGRNCECLSVPKKQNGLRGAPTGLALARSFGWVCAQQAAQWECDSCSALTDMWASKLWGRKCSIVLQSLNLGREVSSAVLRVPERASEAPLPTEAGVPAHEPVYTRQGFKSGVLLGCIFFCKKKLPFILERRRKFHLDGPRSF